MPNVGVTALLAAKYKFGRINGTHEKKTNKQLISVPMQLVPKNSLPAKSTQNRKTQRLKKNAHILDDHIITTTTTNTTTTTFIHSYFLTSRRASVVNFFK